MKVSTPTRRPWTAGERKKLDELKNAGKTAPEIATALQRTPISVYSQLQRLEIKKANRRLVELGLKAKNPDGCQITVSRTVNGIRSRAGRNVQDDGFERDRKENRTDTRVHF
jgi:IS30 family transposase